MSIFSRRERSGFVIVLRQCRNWGMAMARHDAPKPLITNPLRRGHRRWKVVALLVVSIALIATAQPTALSVALGLPLIVAGVALRIWAAGHLLKTRELTVSGPYAYTRNPLYVGTFGIGAGFALLSGTTVAAFAVPIGLLLFFGNYFPRKERTESALLEKLYGEQYRAYHAAVPALLPRLRAWSPAGVSARPWRFERVRRNSELGVVLTVGLALALLTVRAQWEPGTGLRALRSSEPPVIGQLAPALEQPEKLVVRR
jgi:protein-S-isoprenylcysteine O-methyltransferase Ste14